MGGEAVIDEGQLREIVNRLSILHDHHADLSEEIMAIISEGGEATRIGRSSEKI
jgi:hypothetical protein